LLGDGFDATTDIGRDFSAAVADKRLESLGGALANRLANECRRIEEGERAI
jgi:hypothetical protein